MAFPDIQRFPESHPGPYERQMGRMIAGLLQLFAGRVPDLESHASVARLAGMPSRWSAAHAAFDEVRNRFLAALEAKNGSRLHQYAFEESCCQAMYNATDPVDPFDPGSPFFVVPQAFSLAQAVGVPVEDMLAALASK